MRQKCEFCKTSPELNDKGTCPNCGAAMPILRERIGSYYGQGIFSVDELRNVAFSSVGFDPRLGSPMITGSPWRNI